MKSQTKVCATQVLLGALKPRALTTALLITSLFASAPGQAPPPQNQDAARPRPQKVEGAAGETATPRQDEEGDEIVRINSNLIQVDAVVTDERGRQVTDLSAEDFEVIESGRARQITNFSYINNRPPGADESLAGPASSAPSSVRPARLRREQLRRTVVFVVDDLTMSFENSYQVRRAVKRFVEEQLAPGDLAAVVRASAGVGALQQLTADRTQLLAAAERIRGLEKCKSEMFKLEPAVGAVQPEGGTGGRNPILGGRSDDTTFGGDTDAGDTANQAFASGVLGAVSLVVRGLRDVPGRKAVVLLSDGPPVCTDPGGFGPTYSERLRRMVDLAHRASVVFYALDANGLPTLDSAAENVPGAFNPSSIGGRLRAASQAIFDNQSAWVSLVEPTGGFLAVNSNDLAGGLRRVAEDQSGYYLLGYRPDDSTFEPRKEPRFYSLKVKVKRPGLKVRTRAGFYGLTDEQSRPARPRTRDEQLLAGLTSPFSTGQIDVRLTSLFGNEPEGSSVLSMLHIDPRGLTFAEQPDGWRQAVLDVLAIIFDADGRIVEQVNRTQTVRARGETLRRITGSGLVYSLSVPAKKPGGYQLRIAVRDAASERVGSAGQFVEVPDLGRGRLTLSGVTLQVVAPETPAGAASATTAPSDVPARAGKGGEGAGYDPQGGPALRRFRRETVLEYGYAVYNPRSGKGAKQPQVRTRIILFRDGRQVFAGRPQALDAKGQSDASRLRAGGRLRLGPSFPPGEYVLQVVVTDALADEKHRVATQWIDFEVVN